MLTPWASTGSSSSQASVYPGLILARPTLSTSVVLTHLSSITAFCDISPMLQMRKLRQQEASILAQDKTIRKACNQGPDAGRLPDPCYQPVTTLPLWQGSELIPGTQLFEYFVQKQCQ